MIDIIILLYDYINYIVIVLIRINFNRRFNRYVSFHRTESRTSFSFTRTVFF